MKTRRPDWVVILAQLAVTVGGVGVGTQGTGVLRGGSGTGGVVGGVPVGRCPLGGTNLPPRRRGNRWAAGEKPRFAKGAGGGRRQMSAAVVEGVRRTREGGACVEDLSVCGALLSRRVDAPPVGVIVSPRFVVVAGISPPLGIRGEGRFLWMGGSGSRRLHTPLIRRLRSGRIRRLKCLRMLV